MGMEVGVASELVAGEGRREAAGGGGGGGVTRQAETRRDSMHSKRPHYQREFFLCNPSAIMCNRQRRQCARVSAD